SAEQGRDPFAEAVQVQQRLFTTKPILLGVEESMKHPIVPCGLKTDAERARHVRKRVRQMLNSRGEWEVTPAPTEKALRDICAMEPLPESAVNLLKLRSGANDEARMTNDERNPNDQTESPFPMLPVLTVPEALEKIGQGLLCVVGEENGRKIYGRCTTVAERAGHEKVILVKWVRRLINWHGRDATLAAWKEKVAPLIQARLAAKRTPVIRFDEDDFKITAVLSLADLSMRVPVDSYGVPIW